MLLAGAAAACVGALALAALAAMASSTGHGAPSSDGKGAPVQGHIDTLGAGVFTGSASAAVPMGTATSAGSTGMVLALATSGSSDYADMAGAVEYVRSSTQEAVNRASAAHAAGVRFGTLLQGEGGSIGAINPQAYAAEALAAVKQTSPVAFEVLNEPGGSWFWSDPNNFSAYVALLKATHEAFAALPAASRPKILASWDGGGAGRTWGDGWKNLGGLAYVDGVTVHPYGGTGERAESALGDRGDVEQAHAESGLPVYVTEIGWPTDVGGEPTGDSLQWTESQQAENITNFITWAKSTGYTAMVVIFAYRDYGINSWYGIEREDGSRKLSYAALAAFKAGGATTATTTEYALPEGSGPASIVQGPDGNLWFTDQETAKIGKTTPSGTITEYALPIGSYPIGLAAGSDGNLWFTDAGTSKVGKITPTGAITEYSLPLGSWPTGIAAGPEGNLWFVDYGTEAIGKITPSGAITEYSIPGNNGPYAITAGPDGDLWFTDLQSSEIGRITPSGAITRYPLPAHGYPKEITAGPDGNLWFTDAVTDGIGKITTSGAITEYALPTGSHPEGITAFPNGNLWFTDNQASRVGQIAPSGAITEYSLPRGGSPAGITAGPDGDLWFTSDKPGKVGKVSPTPE